MKDLNLESSLEKHTKQLHYLNSFEDDDDVEEDEEDVLAFSGLTMPVHGFYCGPGYCDGKKEDSRLCTFKNKPVDSLDNCCLVHDKCCNKSKNKAECVANKCDVEIIKCASSTNSIKSNFIAGFFSVYGGCCGYY